MIRVLRRLRKAGVETVINVPREWRNEWKHPDFDPGVLRWIASLVWGRDGQYAVSILTTL